MTDDQFMAELKIRAYVDQISGYQVGNPGRVDFKPIVPTIGGRFLNRKRTLELPCYGGFTIEEREILLKP